MSIHVMIKRKWLVTSCNSREIFSLLGELRALARKQPGYLSTQTLRNVDQPEYILVLSRWENIERWSNWMKNDEHRETQAKIDSLIGEKTFYEVLELINHEGEALAGIREREKWVKV